MPLGTKTVTELWQPIINKSTGQPYAGLEKCASLARLEEDNKPLSDLLDKELNAWLDKDPDGNTKILQDVKAGGFKYKHTDGLTYKIVQFGNGDYALSRSKPFSGGAGGYRRTGTSYVHLRTNVAKLVRVEDIPKIIDNQEDNDNWEIVALTPDGKGDKFLLLNKKPYTPTAEVTSNAKEDTKEDNSEAEAETEVTQ